MPPIGYVTKQLIILNVLFFIASQLYPALQVWLPMFPFSSEHFKPVQMVTYMFMHANFSHLLFNMIGIYFFGSALERVWNPKKFLTFYFICGFGAMLLWVAMHYVQIGGLSGYAYQRALNTPMLGASGALYGILVGYAMLFPDSKVQLIFPPIALTGRQLVLVYGVLMLFDLIRGGSNVAHFAHLGGALFGALLVLYWRKNKKLY